FGTGRHPVTVVTEPRPGFVQPSPRLLGLPEAPVGQGQPQPVEHRTARSGVGPEALLEAGDRLLEPAGAVSPELGQPEGEHDTRRPGADDQDEAIGHRSPCFAPPAPAPIPYLGGEGARRRPAAGPPGIRRSVGDFVTSIRTAGSLGLAWPGLTAPPVPAH